MMTVGTTQPLPSEGPLSQVCVKTGGGSWDCRFGYSPTAVVDGDDPRTGGIAGIVGQGAWRHGMLAIDCLGESRVRENLTHGLGRGRWRRSSQTHGDGLSPRWETSGPRQPGLQVWVATAPAPYFTVVSAVHRQGGTRRSRARS